MEKEIESYNHSIMSLLPISNARLERLKQEPKSDPQLAELAQAIQKGWPSCRKNLPPTLTPFWNIRHELTVVHEIIMKGDRLVIPRNSRKDILSCIHSVTFGYRKNQTMSPRNRFLAWNDERY